MACDTCRTGNVHFCKDGGLNTTLGIFIDGGWGQFCLALGVQVYRIPDSITMEQGTRNPNKPRKRKYILW